MTMSSIKSGFLTVVATGVVAGTVAYSGLIKPDMIETSLMPSDASAKVEKAEIAETPAQAKPEAEAKIATIPEAPKKPEQTAKLETPASKSSNKLAKETLEAVGISEPDVQTPSAEAATSDNTVAVPVETTPAFDVLRVEKDGSVLVAGRASANSEIDVVSEDGTVIATSLSGTSGDFVAVPKTPLKPGNYALTIVAKPADGESSTSRETGIVRIPKFGEDALAIVSPDQAPSRIVLKPSAFEKTPIEIQPKVKLQQPDGLKPKTNQEILHQKTEAETAPQKLAKVEPTSPQIVVPKSRPNDSIKKSKLDVVVEAVEVENGTVYVAGAAPKGAAVRIYIDNEPLGLTRGTGDNRFLLTRKFDLKAGMHQVRVDEIDRNSGKVLSRAEVPLIHTVEEVIKEVPVVKPTPAPKVLSGKVAPENQSVKAQKAPLVTSPAETEVSAEIETVQKQEPVKTGTTIIIKPGDNLWRISRRTYGRGIRYTTIYNANRDQIRNPSRIYVGQIFKIPAAEQPISVE